MSCSLNHINESFGNLFENTDRVDITDHIHQEHLLRWANVVNSTARGEKFGADIFSVENIDGRLIMSVDKEVSINYDTYINDILRPTLNLDEIISKKELQDVYFQLGLLDEYSERTQEDFDISISETDDMLYSPVNLDSDDSETLGSSENALYEWAELKSNLIKDIDKAIKRTRSDDKGKGNVKRSLSLIQSKFKDQIDKLRAGDAAYLHENISSEVDALLGVLRQVSITDNPEEVINLFEGNAFERRIKDLETVFVDVDGENYDYVYKTIHNGLTETSVAVLSKKVKDLRLEYNRNIDKLVYSILRNNEYFQSLEKVENTAEGKEKIKKMYEAIEKLIENPDDMEGGWLGKHFLGASGYDNILANVLSILRGRSERHEKGVNSLNKKILARTYPKLAAAKMRFRRGKAHYYLDEIWEYDQYGVRTDKIISSVDEDWREHIFERIREAQKEFSLQPDYSIEKVESYQKWMDLVAENFNVFNLTSLKPIRDKYSHLTEFVGLFDEYDETEALEYEKSLREDLGELAFEMELARIEELIEDFLSTPYLNFAQSYTENPLVFSNNFHRNRGGVDAQSGQPILPKFIRYSPKKEDVNPALLRLENIYDNLNLGNEFRDFYKALSKVQKYIADSKSLEEIAQDRREVGYLEDRVNRQVMSELNLFGKIGRRLGNILSTVVSTYKEGSYEDEANTQENIKDEDRELQSHFSDGNLEIKRKYREFLDTKSNEDLERIARRNKLHDLDEVNSLNRAAVIDSLIRKRFNRHTSLDIYKRVMSELELSESYNTRKSVESIAGIFIYFANLKGLKRTEDFLRVYRAQNIYEVGRLQGRAGSKIDRQKLNSKFGNKIGIFKTLSSGEKYFKKFLESEKKNLEGDYDFTFNNIKYYRRGDSYYYSLIGKEREETSKEVVEKAYESYLNAVLEELGRDRILGRVITGIAWNMNRYYLGINPMSGIKNFLQGQDQNRERAASGLFSYNMDQYYRARRLFSAFVPAEIVSTFLGGDSNKELARKVTSTLLLQNKKYKQLQVVKHLAENMNLINTVVKDLSGGDGSSQNLDYQTRYSKFVSAYSIDIPEFMNQMVILVAMMQDDKFMIEDIYGNRRTLYDPKHKHPFPFDLDTMELLPEYKTETNIANWERFEADESGFALHEVLLQQFENNRNVTQGNYDISDRIGISSTAIGHSVTAFMKWSYENGNSYWGGKKVDPIFGYTNLKGKAYTMVEKYPALAVSYYLTSAALDLNNLIPQLTKLFYDPAGLVQDFKKTGVSLTLAAGVIGHTLVKVQKEIRERQKENLSLIQSAKSFIRSYFTIQGAKEAAGVSSGFFAESVLRTLDTGIRSTTGNRIGIISHKKLENLVGITEENYKNRTISLQERKQISSMAQNIANKLNTTRFYFLLGMGLKAMYSLLLDALGDDDEDEDERAVRQEKILNAYEGQAKYIVNNMHDVIQDSEQWMDPRGMLETYGAFIFYSHLDRSQNSLIKAYTKFSDGESGYGDLAFGIAKHGVFPAVGGPVRLLDVIDSEAPAPFSSKRVYEGSGFMEDYIVHAMKDPEEKAKIIVEENRNDIRAKNKPRFERQIDELAKEQGTHLTKDAKTKIINYNFEKFYKESGIKKNKDNSYQSIYESVDWREVHRKAKELNIESLESSAPKAPPKGKKMKSPIDNVSRKANSGMRSPRTYKRSKPNTR